MICNEESQMLIKWKEDALLNGVLTIYLFFLTIAILLPPMQLIGIRMHGLIRLIIGITQLTHLTTFPEYKKMINL